MSNVDVISGSKIIIQRLFLMIGQRIKFMCTYGVSIK
jgi:hypothetical protein